MGVLLSLLFGVTGLMFGGLWIVLSIRVPKRFFTVESDLGWRRVPLFLGGVIFSLGTIAFVAPTFWLKMLTPAHEYPAGRASGVITTEKGCASSPWLRSAAFRSMTPSGTSSEAGSSSL